MPLMSCILSNSHLVLISIIVFILVDEADKYGDMLYIDLFWLKLETPNWSTTGLLSDSFSITNVTDLPVDHRADYRISLIVVILDQQS
jgi:hypothetical protein